MARVRLVRFAVAAALAAGAMAGCSSSSKTTTSTTSTVGGGGVTAPTSSSGSTVNVVAGDTKGTDAPMTLVAATTSAKAGDVTFTVKNTGTVDHEMVVLKTDLAFDKLPVVDGGDPPAAVTTGATKVDEANNIGETGDPNLKPGQSRSFTINGLAAGNYVLVCNIALHYGLGMRAAFTVS